MKEKIYVLIYDHVLCPDVSDYDHNRETTLDTKKAFRNVYQAMIYAESEAKELKDWLLEKFEIESKVIFPTPKLRNKSFYEYIVNNDPIYSVRISDGDEAYDYHVFEFDFVE